MWDRRPSDARNGLGVVGNDRIPAADGENIAPPTCEQVANRSARAIVTVSSGHKTGNSRCPAGPRQRRQQTSAGSLEISDDPGDRVNVTRNDQPRASPRRSPPQSLVDGIDAAHLRLAAWRPQPILARHAPASRPHQTHTPILSAAQPRHRERPPCNNRADSLRRMVTPRNKPAAPDQDPPQPQPPARASPEYSRAASRHLAHPGRKVHHRAMPPKQHTRKHD